MSQDSNTLDDLVAFCRDNVARCARYDCDRPAPRLHFGKPSCDAHSDGSRDAFDVADADRIRRLEKAGLL